MYRVFRKKSDSRHGRFEAVRGIALGRVIGVLVVMMSMPVLAADPMGSDKPLRPLVATFHVHSTASTGDLSLDQLAERAEKLGLEAVILTDNFVLRYEYGLFPLRGMIRRTFTIPSVLDYGLERFLADVEAAQARHPRVLLIPGVEVAPHYFWTGSLPGRDLTMHNSQKNLLVFGLPRAEDYAALPVNGNPASYRYGWSSLVNVAPGLLLVPAVWLWQRRTYKATKVGVTAYRMTKRYRAPALALGIVGGLLLVSAWPFGQSVFSAYDDQLGYRPYQAFIDAATGRGGVVVWSMPEARDFNVYPFGPLGDVTIKTDPYPEALLRTTGYTGFGGVYQDTRTVTLPGGIWDQLLGLYLARQRSIPPYASGEIAFHGLNRDTRELDQVLTVLLVRDRTPAEVVEAFRSGRLYAVGQYQKGLSLRLDTFQVESGGEIAGAGEALEPEDARDLAVRLAVSATDKGPHPIAVTIVRSGQVVAQLTGVTPFVYRFADETIPPGEPHFYRVEIMSGSDGEIMSNPIFVGPGRAIGSQPSAISLE